MQNDTENDMTPPLLLTDARLLDRYTTELLKSQGNEEVLGALRREIFARMAPPRTFLDQLRAATIARQKEWYGEKPPGLSYRGLELAGETGEACNVLKKLEREREGWVGSRDTVEHLAEEVADVFISADIVAMEFDIGMEVAIRAKFNMTSEKYGLKTRL